MVRIIVILAIALILWIWWRTASAKNAEERKKYLFKSLAGVILFLLIILAATGRLHWLVAAAGAAAAMIPRLLGLLRYLPLISRLNQGFRSRAQPGEKNSRPSSGAMNPDEALAILGLKAGVTQAEIIAAHRRLMQKVHPDHGGSDHLAAQLNQARDTLLSQA